MAGSRLPLTRPVGQASRPGWLCFRAAERAAQILRTARTTIAGANESLDVSDIDGMSKT